MNPNTEIYVIRSSSYDDCTILGVCTDIQSVVDVLDQVIRRSYLDDFCLGSSAIIVYRYTANVSIDTFDNPLLTFTLSEKMAGGSFAPRAYTSWSREGIIKHILSSVWYNNLTMHERVALGQLK